VGYLDLSKYKGGKPLIQAALWAVIHLAKRETELIQ